MIRVTVNGKTQTLGQPTPLLSFLKANHIQQKMIAIGRNGEVIHRDQWSTVQLADGDILDIVQMVGGG